MLMIYDIIDIIYHYIIYKNQFSYDDETRLQKI